jgi:hypothetical protein
MIDAKVTQNLLHVWVTEETLEARCTCKHLLLASPYTTKTAYLHLPETQVCKKDTQSTILRKKLGSRTPSSVSEKQSTSVASTTTHGNADITTSALPPEQYVLHKLHGTKLCNFHF